MSNINALILLNQCAGEGVNGDPPLSLVHYHCTVFNSDKAKQV